MKLRLLLTLCLSAAAAASTASANLNFEKSHIALKADPGAEFVDAEYPLTNTGSEVVTITRIKPSCGCTFAEVDDRELAPGESTVLKTRFDIGERQGMQRKSIRVESTSGAYVVTLEVDIPLRWEIDTRFLAWDLSKSESADAKSALLVFNYNTPVELVDVRTLPEGFQAEVEQVEAEKGKAAFVIQVTPQGVGSNVRGTLRAVFQNATGEKETITLFLRTL